MKTFVKENWYKLMIGCSMFIFSISALLYSASPVRAENVFKEKSNGIEIPFFIVVNGVVYFTSGSNSGGTWASWEKCKYQPGK